MNAKSKSKKNPTVQQIVLRLPNSIKQAKQSSKKKKGPPKGSLRSSIQRPIPVSLSSEAKIRLAFKDPFDPRALGCTAPDDWKSVGLVPYHIRFQGTITSDAAGNIQLGFYPSPTLSMLMDAGGSSAWSAYSNFGIAFGAATDTTWGAIFASFRPVVGAVRFRNGLSFNNITGRGITATVPCCGGGQLNQTILSAASSGYITPLIKGQILGNDGDVPNGGMASLPGAKTFAMDQIIQEDTMVRLLPTGSTAYKFRNMSQTTARVSLNSYLLAQGVDVDTAGVDTITTQTGQNSGMDLTDWLSAQLYITGLPVSVPCLNFDYILHLEGRPTVNNAGSYANCVPSNTNQAAAPASVLNKILSNLETVVSVGAEMADMVSNRRGLLGSMARLTF